MKRIVSLFLMLAMLLALEACGGSEQNAAGSAGTNAGKSVSAETTPEGSVAETAADEVPAEEMPAEEPAEEVPEAPAYEPTEEELAAWTEIENALNLANMDPEWMYNANYDAWVLTPLVDVTNPELPYQQGVSVAVPGTYVTGIDTDGDGTADVTSSDVEESVRGSLVIDYDTEFASIYGQTYSAEAAPVILTTGAAGYGSQYNSNATAAYCLNGFIAVNCGNRGKTDKVTDENGDLLYYTGDAPSCLVDQKSATRFVKYNILLGNLPGSVDYFVSTGGSGGAAHAAMFAATSNNPDFYDYQIESGAVGVYRNADGSYSTAVNIGGEQVEISDGVWGAIPYSAITSLYEGDMAQAFEYYMDPTYSFNTEFQARLAEYLSARYMEYINGQNLSVEEAAVGFDINENGDTDDVIDLTIEYDMDKYPETNGYGGTYLDLYLCEFTENLRWYLDNLPYAEGWTWFDADGAALSDEAVAAMTGEDLAAAFLAGRYAKASGGFGGPPAMFGGNIRNGGPADGTTASNGSGTNSANYATYDEMVEAYAADIAEIEAGDRFGKNIVDLYHPGNYIGAEGTDNPTWTRVVMGAVEGDMPMMASLNMQIQWLSAGTEAVIEWQWDGGHVPSEVLGENIALYVDEMYGKYVSGVASEKPEAVPITANGTETSPTGKDLSGWVDGSDLSQVSFTLADVLAYRNAGAMKAVPGFDVIDYGQEDYVFGSSERDARHWDPNLLEIFRNEEYAAVLSDLF